MGTKKIQPVERVEGTTLEDTGMLTPMQTMFVEKLMGDKAFNPTNAAREAGYANPSVAAQKLLKDSRIQRLIGERQAQRVKEARMTAARVLEELASIAFFNPKEMFDDDGRLRRLRELPDEVAACISQFKVSEITSEDGERTTRITEVRLWDKISALTNLAKHFGILKEAGVNVGTLNVINWHELYRLPEKGKEDPIQLRIQQVLESKDVLHSQPSTNGRELPLSAPEAP